LIEIAKILKETFRESDIIARLGGDEFVVLTLEKSVSSDDATTKRLQERLNSQNAHGNRRYCLSLSLGVAHHDPEHPCSIDELITKADLSMYQQKRGVGREWNGSETH
jgi:diguanylate cyclase (GGDEF)-like protein